MKKRIILPLACLLLCSIVAGCQPTENEATDGGAAPAGNMQLAPMQLSDEQSRVLSLADIGTQAFIAYNYQADENLRCITTSRYILNDALEWEPADSGSGQIYNDTPLSPIGTFALTDKRDGQGFTYVLREGGESSSGYTSNASDLPEEAAAEGLTIGVGTQSEAVSIVYGEEIPILVRTFRDKSELYVYNAAKDFADPSRFAGDVFSEAYTVTFSGEIPASLTQK